VLSKGEWTGRIGRLCVVGLELKGALLFGGQAAAAACCGVRAVWLWDRAEHSDG